MGDPRPEVAPRDGPGDEAADVADRAPRSSPRPPRRRHQPRPQAVNPGASRPATPSAASSDAADGRETVAFDDHVGREIAIKEVLDPTTRWRRPSSSTRRASPGSSTSPTRPRPRVGRAASGTSTTRAPGCAGIRWSRAAQQLGPEGRLHTWHLLALCKASPSLHSRGGCTATSSGQREVASGETIVSTGARPSSSPPGVRAAPRPPPRKNHGTPRPRGRDRDRRRAWARPPT
jgi:hypothetical protein